MSAVRVIQQGRNGVVYFFARGFSAEAQEKLIKMINILKKNSLWGDATILIPEFTEEVFLWRKRGADQAERNRVEKEWAEKIYKEILSDSSNMIRLIGISAGASICLYLAQMIPKAQLNDLFIYAPDPILDVPRFNLNCQIRIAWNIDDPVVKFHDHFTNLLKQIYHSEQTRIRLGSKQVHEPEFTDIMDFISCEF